ncbi:MAG: DUF3043 domain-containing protein [Propionibacteriaceae bacterium]|nr:DUF3043 domain-containing protein [Propionibacteriaceae bacterium]
MGFFRPYERTAPAKDATPRTLTPKGPSSAQSSETREATPRETRPTSGKKGAPTPTRKAAEAARMERLHPRLDSKAARKKARQARRIAQDQAWQKAEGSAERTLLRDFVDARWTLIEFMLPAMLVFLALTMLSTYPMFIAIAPYVTILLWVFLVLNIVNVALLWRSFKRELAQRLPKASYRGLLMYLVNRAMMIRRFRQPRPRISRGESY